MLEQLEHFFSGCVGKSALDTNININIIIWYYHYCYRC